MGNGFQFIDIILFAMIAAFLILRLRSVLGRRDGNESNYNDPFKSDPADASADQREAGEDNDNVVQLQDQEGIDAEAAPDAPTAEIADDPLSAGMSQILRVDPAFDVEEFLVGGRVAFEMVLSAYVSGDRETLKNLLSPGVLDNFLRALDDRETAGHVMEDTLVGIRSAEIVEAFMEGAVVNITVKFITEQVNVTRDDQGHVIDGSPNKVTDVVDFWTFERDSRSPDPNWALAVTRSLD